MSTVYLVKDSAGKLLSIWTTIELASSAVLYYDLKHVRAHYEVWQVNVTYEQFTHPPGSAL